VKKIAALHAFLAGLNVVAAKEVDSYVDKLEVIPASRFVSQATTTERVLASCKYTGTFYLSGYPFRRHPVELLVGQISAWLLEFDERRLESGQFSVNVDVLDENGNVADVANLEIDIIFDEAIIVTPNAAGSIMLNGLAYSLL
jgi:hypothetical protein